MTTHPHFDAAAALLDAGEVEDLRALLKEHPDLTSARGEGNEPLLIHLIDYPGHRPRAAESARVLLEAGAEVDARRDSDNGTALAGVLCTNEFDLVPVLLEFGADVHAPLGWMPGTVLEFADRMCQGLGDQRKPEIITLAETFSKAGGRKIPSRAPFGGTTSMLFVSDVEAALTFYKKLGFHVDWMHQEPDCDPYVGISRGSTEFHLTTCECPDKRHTGQLWVRVECDLIDDLHEELKAADVAIRQAPGNRPWGLREMQVEDPDGNRFSFHGPPTED